MYYIMFFNINNTRMEDKLSTKKIQNIISLQQISWTIALFIFQKSSKIKKLTRKRIYNFYLQFYQRQQQNKMRNQSFINSLVDFSDLKPSNQQPNETIERHKGSIQAKHMQFSSQMDLDLGSNEKLIKSFKQLREQLKQSNSHTQRLKTRLIEKQAEIDRLKFSEREYITICHQLKGQVEHLRRSNEDYKAKLELLKDMAKNSNQAEEEIEFLKITVNDLKNTIINLENEKNKILEISILEKVELEEKINKFEAKKGSDIQYVQDMEIQLSKLREKNIKLENQLKKLQIKYDQEVYSKKWQNGNFEREHLQDQLRQAQIQNQQLLAKHKKQKQKRNQLQKRVLELEESTGLWIVKAETYQVQNRALQKKYKKIDKKMEQVKANSDRKVSEVLTLQQKFAKANAIAEQLIARVKRDLHGDVVALAKSCEFKLNKLKQEKQSYFRNYENEQSMRKSMTESKARSKSKPKLQVRIYQEKECDLQTKPSLINLRQKFQECAAKPVAEIINQKQNDQYRDYCSETTNRSLNPLSQIQNIQARIKRERDEMEKKIRQKMIYRKLEVANSPEKHQLREDYFKLFQK